LELKFNTHLEKKKFMPLHLIEVIFQVALAPFSFENRASKKLCVNKVVKTKEVGRWSFKQPFKTLIVGLPSMVHLMTILRAFLATPFYITTTMSCGKPTSNSKSISTGDGPWGSSPKGEMKACITYYYDLLFPKK